MEAAVGDITNTFYLIYDLRNLTFGLADMVVGLAPFARPKTKIEEHLIKHGRMIIVGANRFTAISAKTVARFSPERQYPIFKTVEEAIDYAQAELKKITTLT